MLNNLYIILRQDDRRSSFYKSLSLLKRSAAKKDIAVIPTYSNEFNFGRKYDLGSNDAIYRICDDKKSMLVEKYLMNHKVRSFYHQYQLCIAEPDNVMEATLILAEAGLPTVKTIFDLPDDKTRLKLYAEQLGGFPVIIKATGGSHGIGVMRIDSLPSLFSVADYLSVRNGQFVLRQYIDYTEHARLIVLGNKVVSSLEYKRVPGDFRSNIGNKLIVRPKKFSADIEKTAIKSVRILGYEFGGIDILVDKERNYYITEINFPCYFPRAQKATGIDISGMMIDYLKNKN